nr:MAG TPA: hypothetical protein [Caudoviricetes sp.]
MAFLINFFFSVDKSLKILLYSAILFFFALAFSSFVNRFTLLSPYC